MESSAKLAALLALSRLVRCTGTETKDFPPQLGAKVYVSRDKTASENTRALIESLGGMENLIDRDSIVVIKPNSQWWLQGMTNTDSIMTFIEMVLALPHFAGEVIIADNHQDTVDESRGWTTDQPNGRFNLSDLVDYFNNKGHANVSKYHWHPAGANPTPLQMRGSGNSVVTHPSEGDGYVWPQDLYYESPIGTKTILAYPVFTSVYSGVAVDLKNGAFQGGRYTGQPVKFINYSAINHHSKCVGVTASIKNYMGVVDMSCGYPAPTPEGFSNTHYVGVTPTFKMIRFFSENGHWRIRREFQKIQDARWSLKFKYTGGVLGSYMREIRKADLNIITAQVTGWGSRTDKSMAAETRTLTASTDPVALDYWTCKHVLLPATRAVGANKETIDLNDPDIVDGPFREFLDECRRELGGTIDENRIEVFQS